ncbi:chemotaxis protein CheW [Aliidiomarina minuta]|uniref:Chemotaxis protein CheW n=1 Tax=Aliidiomarina minuta TaxID=880057 RepID=A0A432W8H3_9GAMM|nr:chemotaxis protein CheW [Aliidiomarina minuta]RUO26362.1 chemotaxis protein CheW [Aliidiomarina minuta]
MSSFSRDKAMNEYLDALLLETEEPEIRTAPVLDTAKVEKLLQQASAVKDEAFAQTEEQTEPQVEQPVEVEATPVEAEVVAEPEVETIDEVEETDEIAAESEALVEVPPPPVADSMRDYHEGDFQALFFSVAGLKLAVPLKSLGGIHEWKEPSTIFGKPPWYLGIMTNREEKLNVVDTAQWVMPEKYNQEMADALGYRYLIMLNESRWGLACESLVTTESLSPDDVQWRKSSNGKRPWLAGVVREKMCAILDVDAMVEMLEQGLNSQD